MSTDRSAAKKTSSSNHESSARKDVDEILKALVFLYAENRRVIKEIAARVNLTGPQFTVVKMLDQSGDMSLSELSDAIRAQNSTVTGIIDRMEREELVERVRSTQDRRVVRIHLTEKGKRVAQQIPVEPLGIFRNALVGLSAEEARLTLKIVNKISARVRAALPREFRSEVEGDESEEE